MTKSADLLFQTILVIDTTGRDVTKVGLVHDDEVRKLEKPVRAQELQGLIFELINQAGLKIEDLSAVAVLQGPGSFTGTRIGVTTANTLYWLTGQPILEVPGADFDKALNALAKTPTQFKATNKAKVIY